MTVPVAFSTPRLTAECIRLAHTAEIFRMHQDPEQMAMLGGVRDEEQSAAYMVRALQHWEEFAFGVWMLRDRQSGESAGRVLLRHLLLDGVNELEVGYSLYPAYWGRGLALEAASACMRFARAALPFTSVVALTATDHVRSQQVLRKLGMAFDREIERDGQRLVLFRTGVPDSASGATVPPRST